MELERIRFNENVLEFTIDGEDHTYLNVLRQILSEEIKGVQFAAYKALQNSTPKFYIRVQPGEDPINIIALANDKIVQYCDELFNQIEELKKDLEKNTK